MPLTNKLVSNVCILFALHFHLSRLLKKSWGLCIYSDAHFLLDAVFKCFHIGREVIQKYWLLLHMHQLALYGSTVTLQFMFARLNYSAALKPRCRGCFSY